MDRRWHGARRDGDARRLRDGRRIQLRHLHHRDLACLVGALLHRGRAAARRPARAAGRGGACLRAARPSGAAAHRARRHGCAAPSSWRLAGRSRHRVARLSAAVRAAAARHCAPLVGSPARRGGPRCGLVGRSRSQHGTWPDGRRVHLYAGDRPRLRGARAFRSGDPRSCPDRHPRLRPARRSARRRRIRADGGTQQPLRVRRPCGRQRLAGLPARQRRRVAARLCGPVSGGRPCTDRGQPRTHHPEDRRWGTAARRDRVRPAAPRAPTAAAHRSAHRRRAGVRRCDQRDADHAHDPSLRLGYACHTRLRAHLGGRMDARRAAGARDRAGRSAAHRIAVAAR